MSKLFLLTLLIGGRLAVCAFSAQSPALPLPPLARCHGEGIYLTDPFASSPTARSRTLNALGVTPRDMMAIFQTIKSAGLLQAELVVR